MKRCHPRRPADRLGIARPPMRPGPRKLPAMRPLRLEDRTRKQGCRDLDDELPCVSCTRKQALTERCGDELELEPSMQRLIPPPGFEELDDPRCHGQQLLCLPLHHGIPPEAVNHQMSACDDMLKVLVDEVVVRREVEVPIPPDNLRARPRNDGERTGSEACVPDQHGTERELAPGPSADNAHISP